MTTGLETLRVLLADDNPHMREIVGVLLKNFGIKHIRSVADGSQGLNELRHWPADLAIVDFKMAPMDGVEFTRLIRTSSESRNPYLPVIMMTGPLRPGAGVRGPRRRRQRVRGQAGHRPHPAGPHHVGNLPTPAPSCAPRTISAPTAAAAPIRSIPVPCAARPTPASRAAPTRSWWTTPRSRDAEVRRCRQARLPAAGSLEAGGGAVQADGWRTGPHPPHPRWGAGPRKAVEGPSARAGRRFAGVLRPIVRPPPGLRPYSPICHGGDDGIDTRFKRPPRACRPPLAPRGGCCRTSGLP